LRIWSAGCANGAEPYSIAICLAENMYRLRDWSLTILGTDLSEDMLRTARAGSYKPRTVEAVSEQQRRRYFQHRAAEDAWEVRPEIKRMVDFQRHNLIEPQRESGFDCVFIRNVLIYFDQESKRVAINHLLNALAVGGYLVVGPSEGIHEMLGSLRKHSPLLYQKVAPNTPRGTLNTGGGARP
jgi:chemotaxis protein methyltransferase CheR